METREDTDNVFYCKECLSLRIMEGSGGLSYCDKCGGVDIGEIGFDEWDEAYEVRYGRRFLDEE